MSRSLIRSSAEGVYGGGTTIVLSIFGNGLAAVNLFFLISGFVLLQSLTRGPASHWKYEARFVFARLFRIYPAAIVTVGIFALVFYAIGPNAYTPLSIVRNALLIDWSINGVMWSLKVEVIAIPLFLIGFILFRRFGVSGLIVLLITLLVLATSTKWTRLVETPFGLGLLPFFAVGMLVFGAGARSWLRLPPHTAAFLLLVAFATSLAAESLPRHGVRHHHIEMVCDAFIVGLLAFGNLGVVGRFFDHQIVRFYGRISYSFYLINPLTLLVYWNMPSALGRVMEIGIPPAAVGLILLVVSVAFTTPIAWLMHKYVEQPFVSIGRLVIARQFGNELLQTSTDKLRVAEPRTLT